MEKPLCKSCQQRHWRFVKCVDAVERNVQEDENTRARNRPVFTVHQPQEGFVPWGDRLGDTFRVNNTYYRQERKPSDRWLVGPPGGEQR